MSRSEENQELLNRAQLSFTGAPEKVMCNIEAQKLGILMDISKSLAIIADGLNDELTLRRCNMREMKYGEPVSQLLDVNWYDDGMAYAVVNTRGSHPCAYIRFPGIEKVKNYESLFIDEDIYDTECCIHGNFTFLGSLEHLGLHGIWIGWDYAHIGDYLGYGHSNQAGDKKWKTEEVVAHAKRALEYIRKGKYEIVE